MAKASILELPVLPIRDSVMFPHALHPLHIATSRSVRLLRSLHGPPPLVVTVAQRNAEESDPTLTDLYSIGTSARVVQLQKMEHDDEHYVAIAQGAQRVRILEGTQRDPFLKARVEPLTDVVPETEDAEYAALKQSIRDLFSEVIQMSPNLSNDLLPMVAKIGDASMLADFGAFALPSLATPVRQALLETLDVRVRMRKLVEELLKERDILRLQLKIQSEIEAKVSETQRELFLREQLKAIQRELGEGDEASRIIDELRKKLEAAGLPDGVKKEATAELSRLQQIPPASPEYAVSRTYLEWLAMLPWSRSSAERADVKKAQQVLDEDHYDLEKVKERIVEYLAVLQLKPELKGPILCFVGPPGVGKTSLGKSIARALGRRFARISLGGMHDEAEIRGHRRTYVGALPGQIIQGIRRAGTNDPVFMLDEVDKLGRDFRGDPAAALMEVLDPEQNSSFRDHYLDVPFDLSKVLFITTANVLEPIPPALLDRMEVLELPGYTEDEKLHIARRYLIPRQVAENGLEVGVHIRFTDEAVREIVRSYTHEAGVRNVEREIGALCRKHAKSIAGDGAGLLVVTPEVVRERLGPPRFHVETELEERCRKPGVAVGLAWTPHGGDVLFVEAARIPHETGQFTVTGQLGQVMQESTKAALTWLKANAPAYGIDPRMFRKYDVHLHVPSGAVPKDGPSAGLVMVAALYSLFAQHPVRPRVAMTGEITLSGEVLPVGGIKEKVLAAKQSGVREVLVPEKNQANVMEDIPAHLREGIQFHFVRTIDDMIEHLFVSPGAALAEPRAHVAGDAARAAAHDGAQGPA